MDPSSPRPEAPPARKPTSRGVGRPPRATLTRPDECDRHLMSEDPFSLNLPRVARPDPSPRTQGVGAQPNPGRRGTAPGFRQPAGWQHFPSGPMSIKQLCCTCHSCILPVLPASTPSRPPTAGFQCFPDCSLPAMTHDCYPGLCSSSWIPRTLPCMCVQGCEAHWPSAHRAPLSSFPFLVSASRGSCTGQPPTGLSWGPSAAAPLWIDD